MDNNIGKVIGKRINTLLAEHGVKQKELAQHLQIPDNTISYFVKGTRIPNTQQIIKIAQYFNVSSDYLLGLSLAESTDKDIQFISKYTGLSEKAINILYYFRDVDILIPTINLLIESEGSNFLDELGYVQTDVPDNKTITIEDYEELQIISAIGNYINLRKSQNNNKTLSITRSGKIVSLSETDIECAKHTSWEDLISLQILSQYDIIEKVLFDKIMNKIKALKNEVSDNGNHTKT